MRRAWWCENAERADGEGVQGPRNPFTYTPLWLTATFLFGCHFLRAALLAFLFG